MAESEQITAQTCQFLRGFAPFSRMAAADLAWLATHLKLAYFPASTLITAAAADSAPLYVVRRGHLRVEQGAAELAPLILGPGECFPLPGQVEAPQGAPAGVSARYVATEDLFCFDLEQHRPGDAA